MQTSVHIICRHNAILARLHECGYICTDELAKELNVSVHTIRHDLNILEGQNQLRRYHGGAVGVNTSRALTSDNEQINAIAKAIVSQLEAGSCLYVDSPSIGALLVDLLPEEVYYLITQHIDLIGIARKNPFIRIFFLGRDFSPGGDDASIQMSMAKCLPRKVEHSIVEVDYIDNKGVFFDNCFQRASVKRYFLHSSQHQYIVYRKGASMGRPLVKIDTSDYNKQIFMLTQ